MEDILIKEDLLDYPDILYYPKYLDLLIMAQREELRKRPEEVNHERLDNLETLCSIAESTKLLLSIPWTCPEGLKRQKEVEQIWKRKKIAWESWSDTNSLDQLHSSPSRLCQSLMVSSRSTASSMQSASMPTNQFMGVERTDAPQFSMASPERALVPCCQPVRYGRRHPQYVNIFIDLSNISISAKRIEMSDPFRPPMVIINDQIRVKYDTLHQIILGDRHSSCLVAVGSYPTGHRYVVGNYDYLTWLGYSTKFFSRNCGEHGVDDFILSSIRERMRSSSPYPGEKIVIVTGDGNHNHGKDTFPKVIQSALNDGWEVEVWAWYHGCNLWYKSLEDKSSCYRQYSRVKSLPPNTDNSVPQQFGLRSLVELSRFQLHYLDGYREYIT